MAQVMLRHLVLIGASPLLWVASAATAEPSSAPATPPTAADATSPSDAPKPSVGRADAPADAAAIRHGTAARPLAKLRAEPVGLSLSPPTGPHAVGAAKANARILAGPARPERPLHLLHCVWLR
jgi:hypothetical protein